MDGKSLMQKRLLGQNLEVSAIGLGCMGMSEFYGSRDDDSSIRVMHEAIDNGINFFDTADMYGPFHNEELVGRFMKERGRDSIVIATKFGIVRGVPQSGRTIDNSPEYIKACCEASLKRLNIDQIDLYYVHRYNPEYPIEDVMGALSKLVHEGKVKHIGLSEVNPTTLRRAHAVHPVTALQTEYSIWSRHVESELLQTCNELNIGFVAYSPIGRGFLTGTQKTLKAFSKDDARRTLPRFHEKNLEANQIIPNTIEQLAAKVNCTPAQLSLAWVLAKGDFIVPIPGTKTLKYVNENAEAASVKIPSDIMSEVNHLMDMSPVSGERYAPIGMTGLNT
jgi:aryl-alcohol dehydrogenase-like predicted oxidoreductase